MDIWSYPQESMYPINSWCNCQDLAQEAWLSGNLREKERLIREAFAEALGAGGPNRIVSASSWPLKVVAAGGDTGWLEAETERLLHIIAAEPSPVRRAHALNLMLGAVLRGPRGIFLKVLADFRQACLTPVLNGRRNKRGHSCLSCWIPVVHLLEPDLAHELLEQIQGPVLRRRAAEGISRHAARSPEELCGWPHFRGDYIPAEFSAEKEPGGYGATGGTTGSLPGSA